MSEFIRVAVDYKDAQRGLSDIEKEQFPYAYAATLWQVARSSTRAVAEVTRARFKLHGEFIPRGILSEPARVKQIKNNLRNYGLADVTIFTSKGITPFMGLHEKGGTKQAVKGRSAISIPTADFLAKGIQTATGAIKKGSRPKSLLKYYNAHKNDLKRKRAGLPRPFVLNGAVVRRVGKERHPLVVMYYFRKTARIKARWGFEPTVRAVVEATFSPAFEFNFKRAMMTARAKGNG